MPATRCFPGMVLLLACLPTWLSADEHPKPNVLFLFADDWGRYASIYAERDGTGTLNDVVQTPHFDQLAREGVLFRRAFVSAPSCTPCRSALLTGQHFWRTGRGAILNGAVWEGKIPTFPLILRDSGYHIGETYKVWSPGTPVDAPYGAPEYSYEKAGRRFNKFSSNLTRLIKQGVTPQAGRKQLFDEVRGNFEDFLKARRMGTPFCYWFGPTNVHRQWERGSGRKLWNIDPDKLQGKLPKFLPDVPEVREDLADYFGEIQAFDTALGLLIARLKETGEYENTLIIVSGDHGPPGFPHGKCNLYDFGTGVSLAVRGPGVMGGRVVDDLVSLTDLAPTILEAAGLKPTSDMTGKSLWDILNPDRPGHVVTERSAIFTGRERHVSDAREGFVPYPQRAIRTRDFLYIINFHPERWPQGDPFQLDSEKPPTFQEIMNVTRTTFADEDAGPTKAWLVTHREDSQWKDLFQLAYGKRPREELYDLKTDPDQVKNVAADPPYAAVRADLEKRLLDELHRTKDPRLIDDGKYFETPPLAGPAR
ncbi:MAG: sulfatase [Planctomycetales bacterium]